MTILDVRESKLIYKGPHLTQHHAVIWQALIKLALKDGSNGEEPIVIAVDALSREIGSKGKDTRQRARIWGWLRDLANARIEYSTITHDYLGPLIYDLMRTKSNNMLSIRLNPNLIDLVSSEVLCNDLGRKASLGRNLVALWLHDYIATHLRVPPLTVCDLRSLCGSCLELPQFRQRLDAAMDLLTKGEAPLVKSWFFDKDDRMIVEKHYTRVDLPRVELEPETEERKSVPAATKVKVAAAKQARERRADVCL